MVALNDAGSSEPGDPSDPIVIDVPGVQIAPYFVQMLNDCIALEHEQVGRAVPYQLGQKPRSWTIRTASPWNTKR